MNRIWKQMTALGLSLALITSNGMYCYADDHEGAKYDADEVIVYNAETDGDNIIDESDMEQFLTNANDKPVPYTSDETIEITSGLSVSAYEIGEIQGIEGLASVPAPYSDLPENTDPNNAYGVNPNTEYAGNIVNTGEMRWYAFDISQQSKVSIFVMPDTGLDADVHMFRLDTSTMQLFTTDMHATSGGVGAQEYFSYIMDEGVYFFVIYGYSGTGAYLFDFFANANYVDGEVNDTIAAAQAVECGGTYTGLIDTTRDVDYYKITLAQPTFVQVSFTSAISYGMRWVITSNDEVIMQYENQTYLLGAGTHYFSVYSPQYEFSLNVGYTVGLRTISDDDFYKVAPSTDHTNWNYTLDDADGTITLNYYTGSQVNVIVYNSYEIDQTIYKTKIANNTASKSSGYMFAGKDKIKTIRFGNGVDTSETTGMACMFSGCKELIELDVSGLDTSSVTNMYRMFYNCSSITKLDLLAWNTSKVTNMYGMFEGCSSLKALVSFMDTSSVTTMEYMFYGCSSYSSMDLSYFKTGNVTSMYCMFKNCSSLTYVNLDLFDTRKVRNFGSMFENCYSLPELDLRSFYLNGVPQRGNMSYMFKHCESLRTIYVNNAWSQKLSSTVFDINTTGMRDYCPAQFV